MSETDKTRADPAVALEASGDYRVLRKLPRKTEFSADDGTPTKVGIILDIETTGLNPTSDEIIELGMIKFTFSAGGHVFKVLDTFSELREPGVAIPAEVAELTGITPVMVAGHRIDAELVARFVEDAVLIIAHGASFDRPFSEKLFPVFAEKHWACSNTQVDWQSRGHRGTKLTYLLNDFGLFYEGHRALDDCHAVLAVLSSVLPPATRPPLGALLENARKASVRIWAEEAPFDHKDTLRARGYRWSNGTDGTPRAWWKDVDEATAEAELAYLRTEIYKNADLELPFKRLTSLHRFSTRA